METSEPERASHQPRKHALKGMVAKLRRREIIEACLDGRDPKQVAIDMGISPKTADCQTSRIINSPAAKESFVRILEDEGLTDGHLAGKIKSLMDAEHTIYSQWKGKFTDSRKVPALETQRKTVETVLKLKGHLKEQSSGDVNIGLMQMIVQAVQSPSTDDE
jgi:DNA-binding CsgD family transcriptional regulator